MAFMLKMFDNEVRRGAPVVDLAGRQGFEPRYCFVHAQNVSLCLRRHLVVSHPDALRGFREMLHDGFLPHRPTSSLQFVTR